MGKKTCIRIENMKASSEIHNLRLKELDYVRKDLTPLNESWYDPRYEGRSIAEIREDIAKRYKATVGQKVQKSMVMFREAVVVIAENTTMEQLRNLAVAFEEKFGIKTMQIHIHRDEGYQNCKEWKRNLHAHMTFDWTKPNGKSIPSKETPYSKMQTITAEVLGMERGESSDVEHLNAVQYKNKKEGERFLALQQKNTELQAQVEEYQQSNEQLRTENEELLKQTEQIRQEIEELKRTVKALKITKKAKDAMLFGINKITDKLGKSELLLENEQLQKKIEEASKETNLWQGKVEKLEADLKRRTAERDKALSEKTALENTIAIKDKAIDDIAFDLRKAREENLRLGRIAEPWKYTLPDVVKVDRCQVVGTPRGHALQLHIEGNEPQLINISYQDFERYRKAEISMEHLIAIYATHKIDVAVAKKLRRMSAADRKSAMTKLTKTMFHALPAILFPVFNISVPVTHGSNGYVGIRHKSLDEILQDMIDEGYQLKR